MEKKNQSLRDRLTELLTEWEGKERPTRTAYKIKAEELIQWRKKKGIPGLWEDPPLLATATIDDGWGHGLQLIQLWAKALGLKIHPLGLLVKPEEIVKKCLRLNPDFLGMTVLQFDSEDDLIFITRNLPPKTIMIAGGPIFSADPELAGRTGIHFVAKNVAEFVAFMLKFKLDEKK